MSIFERISYFGVILVFTYGVAWPGDDPVTSPDASLICAVLVWCSYQSISAVKDK